jgi:hypothetical protein
MKYEMIIFNITLVLFFLILLFSKTKKSKSKFWISQPIQKRKGVILKKILKNKDNKPELIHKNGYILKKLDYWSIKKRGTVPYYPDNLYKIMTEDPDTKVYTLIDVSKKRNAGYIFGQKQYCPEKDKNIIYVSGLYIHQIYRNKGLSEMLITGIINAWWKECNQFYFIHDTLTISKSIGYPIEEKEISIISPWISIFSKKNGINEKIDHEYNFNIKNEETKNKLIHNIYGVEFHIHNYTMIIHGISENIAIFDSELMYKLSTKYPYIIFMYIPSNICNIKPLKTYTQYLYGWNMMGGNKNEGIKTYNF